MWTYRGALFVVGVWAVMVVVVGRGGGRLTEESVS